MFRLFRLFQYPNIQSYVSLIWTLTHWVFSHVSVIPTIPVFQYSIPCQPDLHTHTLGIQSMHRPFLTSLYSNIQSYVSLIYTLIHWIFSRASVIPTISIFQYSIPCQPDLHTHTLGIQSCFGYSDYSGIPIFNPMLA
jgi:hypothetical protein